MDPDATCTCGYRPCPACQGSGEINLQRAQDYLRLLERGQELLTHPLEAIERSYVSDLLTRLGNGNQPILTDWFRSRELIQKYLKSRSEQ